MSQHTDQPLNILVVDDDILVREVTALMLADVGHAVIEAEDGVEALAKLTDTGAIDLVITDINMPRMDGLALAREMRTRWPGVPVLLVSGRPQPSCLHVMTKPFGWTTLVDTVRRVMCNGPQPVAAGV